jgi:hypothetical protein
MRPEKGRGETIAAAVGAAKADATSSGTVNVSVARDHFSFKRSTGYL